jgi:hypothetical protein
MRQEKYLPLQLIIGFTIFTLGIYAFGPWPWPSNNSWQIYAFMTSALIAIGVGYNQGLAQKTGAYYGKASPKQLYRLSLIISLVLFLPTLLWRTNGDITIDINLILNPAEAYSRSHDIDSFTGTAWIEYIRIFLAVFINLLLPILVIFWNQLTFTDRILGVLATFLEVFSWLAVGTNKGIGDLVVALFWLFLIRSKGRIDPKTILRLSGVVAPVFGLFLVFFTQGQIGRHDGETVQTRNYTLGIQADRDNFFIAALPLVVQDGVISLSSYLTQGYEGLALSLNEPFVPNWGAGNSRFMTSYVDKYFGAGIEHSTYPARVEITTGWNSKIQWHTIFPWLASDFTFPGSIILIGLFSYLFSILWRESIDSSNPFALSLFMQLTVLFTYLSANNQAFQSGEEFIGFFATLAVWLYTRVDRAKASQQHTLAKL